MWDPINQFNPATFLCLSQARTSNLACGCLFCDLWDGSYGSWI
jgi:hypothetical protein